MLPQELADKTHTRACTSTSSCEYIAAENADIRTTHMLQKATEGPLFLNTMTYQLSCTIWSMRILDGKWTVYTSSEANLTALCANNTVVYSFEPIQGTLHKRKGFNLRALDKNIQYSKVEHHVQGFVHKTNKSIQSIVYEKCLYWLKFGCLPNLFLLKRWAFDVLLANGE